jgi:glycosyltransferase involved in cell wall biosynthesis
MKVFYWSPHLSKVATVKAVLNSAESLKNFSRGKINVLLINATGEWDSEKKILLEKNIPLNNLFKNHYYNKLPRHGFLRSRLSYLLIFLRSFFPLLWLLKKEKPNFLIIHLITSLPLILLFFFKFNTKFILRISGFPKINFLRKFLWKSLSQKLYLISCPTIATLENLKREKIFPKEKLIYLPDPIIDIKEYINKLKNKDFIEKNFNNEKSLLAIGRLTRQKNFSFLIKCFKEISLKYDSLNLFIIGEGEEEKMLLNIIKKLQLENKVFLLGYKKNIFNYLYNCKCFLLCSLWEDPGFVLVEAGISNATVISSNCPNGPVEILEKGKNGFLFENNSAKSFVNSFTQFMNSNTQSLKNKKINLKKKIRMFTKFQHYKILNNYLIK